MCLHETLIKRWSEAESFPYLKTIICLPSIPGLYICGNWCSKLHTFWLLLNLRALIDFFSEIFQYLQNFSQNFFMSTLYICRNWCSKLYTFLLLLHLRALIDFFQKFSKLPFIFAEIGVANCILIDYC